VNPACAATADLLGVPAVAAYRLGGAVFEVELGDGDLVVAKECAADAEAAGLAWLAEPGVVPVPTVRGHDGRWLVIDHVEPGEPTADAAARLGHGLAGLHAAGASAHGAPPPGGPADATIGAAPMRNEPAPTWAEFYVEHRVLPYLRAAVDAGTLDPAETTVLARAADTVPEVAGPDEPPSRLHGDLWSGNVLYGRDGRAWLIDPAAHGGHRETDLAMLALFGAPYLERTLAAYREAAPLGDGWAERVPLHQLFPLLVHCLLFGRSYAAQAVGAARAVLSLR
jgi:fructosamine-3-kinase